jgi:hypothetical protein
VELSSRDGSGPGAERTSPHARRERATARRRHATKGWRTGRGLGNWCATRRDRLVALIPLTPGAGRPRGSYRPDALHVAVWHTRHAGSLRYAQSLVSVTARDVLDRCRNAPYSLRCHRPVRGRDRRHRMQRGGGFVGGAPELYEGGLSKARNLGRAAVRLRPDPRCRVSSERQVRPGIRIRLAYSWLCRGSRGRRRRDLAAGRRNLCADPSSLRRGLRVRSAGDLDVLSTALTMQRLTDHGALATKKWWGGARACDDAGVVWGGVGRASTSLRRPLTEVTPAGHDES